MIKTSTHKRIVEELNSNHLRRVGNLEDEIEYVTESMRNWRTRYELLSMTPEIKADTEAAFTRGAALAKRQIKSYLLSTIDKIEVSQ